MKTLLKMIILGGLMVTSAYAENLPALEKNLPTLGAEPATPNQTIATDSDRDVACTRCHDETESKPVLSIYQTPHGNRADARTPSCQSCHGESEKHRSGAPINGVRAAPDIVFGASKSTFGNLTPSDVKDQNAACLSCHDKDPKLTHWQGGPHQVSDVACTSCHQTHAAHDRVLDKRTQPEVCFTCHQEQRAQAHKFSRHPIIEGKAACSECHNSHGSVGPKLLSKNTVTESCFTCHAEKRGPFLWEHQPATEDCTHCHTAHGSNITPLLKSRAPFLCSECHDGPHRSNNPVAGNAAGIQGGLTAVPSDAFTGRACLNCHSMIHGSNHPAGALLQR